MEHARAADGGRLVPRRPGGSAGGFTSVRFTASNPADLPETLKLEVSDDGVGWRTLSAQPRVERALRWGGIALLAGAGAAVRLDVEPIVVRALRLVLAEGHPVADWSIHELELYVSD